MFLNFKEAFTFMFKDEKFWQKYIIGTLFAALILIPNWIMYPKIISKTVSPLTSIGMNFLTLVLGIFIYGFAILYVNSKITLKQDILPEWGKDFGKIVKTGLKYIFGLITFFFACFIAFLPVYIILSIIGSIIMAIIMAPSFAALGPNINPNDPAYTALILKEIIIISILSLPFLLIWITSVFLSMTSFFTDLKFKSFFNLKRMWSMIRGNFLNLVIIAVFFIVYTILGQILSRIIGYNIFFGICLFLNFYMSLVFFNLYAQFAIIGIQKNTERLEEKKAQENLQENSQ